MPGKIINIDPEIMSGTPVSNGTRVPIQSLFDWLETETLDEFLENFPTVSESRLWKLCVLLLMFYKLPPALVGGTV